MELIFEVRDAQEGGYAARSLGHAITMEAKTWEELRASVREATFLHFKDSVVHPRLVYVKEELIPQKLTSGEDDAVTNASARDGEQTEKEPEKDILPEEWFGHFPIWIILTAILLYALGWSYLYGYFSAFGVSLHDIDFGLQEIMMYASPVLGRYWFVPVAAAALIGIGLWIIPRMIDRVPRDFKNSRGIKFISMAITICLGLLLLLALIPWSIGRGRHDADIQMKETTSSLPETRMEIQPVPQTLFIDPIKDGYLEGYRLLVRGHAGYFIFKPLKQPSVGNLNVVFIPKDSVKGAVIIAGGNKENK